MIDLIGRCGTKFGGKTGEYQRLVYENDVDGEVLSELDDDDMVRLGIKSFGHRRVHCAMLPFSALRRRCVMCLSDAVPCRAYPLALAELSS